MATQDIVAHGRNVVFCQTANCNNMKIKLKKEALVIMCFLILGTVSAQSVKFKPISSLTTSVLPKPEGLPFQANYTSSTEVFEENGKYYMIINDLVGGWPCEKINVLLLYSDDLENWTWFEKPLFSSEDLPYKLGKPNGFVTSIVKKGEVYYAFMDVLDNDKNLGIGLATSSTLDGPWKIHAEMVLKPDPNMWDAFSLAGADVVIRNNKFLMYYMGVLNDIPNGETAVGLAESEDGINWKRKNKPVLSKSEEGFDSHKIGVPKVIEDDGGYTMIYRSDDGDGTWGGNSAYGMAQSKDGIKWKKIQKEYVLSENDVDNWYNIWACGLIRVEDTYHLFLEYDGPPVYNTRVNHAIYKSE